MLEAAALPITLGKRGSPDEDHSFVERVGRNQLRLFATSMPGRKLPTYDEVLQLAAKARQSLARQP